MAAVSRFYYPYKQSSMFAFFNGDSSIDDNNNQLITFDVQKVQPGIITMKITTEEQNNNVIGIYFSVGDEQFARCFYYDDNIITKGSVNVEKTDVRGVYNIRNGEWLLAFRVARIKEKVSITNPWLSTPLTKKRVNEVLA